MAKENKGVVFVKIQPLDPSIPCLSCGKFATLKTVFTTNSGKFPNLYCCEDKDCKKSAAAQLYEAAIITRETKLLSYVLGGGPFCFCCGETSDQVIISTNGRVTSGVFYSAETPNAKEWAGQVVQGFASGHFAFRR